MNKNYGCRRRIAIWRSGKFRSCGSARTTNRRMAGEPVWLVQQQRRHDMGSVRQVIDLDVGLFQLAGRGVQLAEFYRSHKYCGYCGHEMYPSKTEWAMLCNHCRERYYPQIAPALLLPSVAMIRSSSPSIPAIVTVSIRYLPDSSKWAKPSSRLSRGK